jgi:hypothetical protein
MKNSATITHDDSLFKVFVVGDYGTGKSIFASTFPTPGFLFDLDRGALTYRGKDFDYCSYDITPQSWIQFEKDILEVTKLTREGKYKTIVLDSTSTLTDLAMERALQLDPKRSPSNGPLWNVHYQIVKNLVEGKLRQIINLPANIVVIGHLQVIQDQESGAVIDVQPLLTGQLSTKIPGYFDEVYCAFSRVKDGKVDYYLRTVPRGLYKARSRISGKERILPDEIPNDYQAIINAVRKVKN